MRICELPMSQKFPVMAGLSANVARMYVCVVVTLWTELTAVSPNPGHRPWESTAPHTWGQQAATSQLWDPSKPCTQLHQLPGEEEGGQLAQAQCSPG